MGQDRTGWGRDEDGAIAYRGKAEATVGAASVQAGQAAGGGMIGAANAPNPEVPQGAAVGKKYDGGKAPLAQGCIGYFPNALNEVADISAYGANKYKSAYADKNWMRVEGAAGRYLDALARHVTAHAGGEARDSESGKRHMAHAAWNALALLELIKQETK